MTVLTFIQQIKSEKDFLSRKAILFDYIFRDSSLLLPDKIRLLTEFIEEFPFELILWRELITLLRQKTADFPVCDLLEILKWGSRFNQTNPLYWEFYLSTAQKENAEATELREILREAISALQFSKQKGIFWDKYLSLVLRTPEFYQTVEKTRKLFENYARFNISNEKAMNENLGLFKEFLENCGAFDPIDRLHLFEEYKRGLFEVKESQFKLFLIDFETTLGELDFNDMTKIIELVERVQKWYGLENEVLLSAVEYLLELAISRIPFSEIAWRFYFDFLEKQGLDGQKKAISFLKVRYKLVMLVCPGLNLKVINFLFIDELRVDLRSYIDVLWEKLSKQENDSFVDLIDFPVLVLVLNVFRFMDDSRLVILSKLIVKNGFFKMNEKQVFVVLEIIMCPESVGFENWFSYFFDVVSALKRFDMSVVLAVKIFRVYFLFLSEFEISNEDLEDQMKRIFGLMSGECRHKGELSQSLSLFVTDFKHNHIFQRCFYEFSHGLKISNK